MAIGPITIGFPFKFSGTAYGSAYVSTNGLVMFNNLGSAAETPQPIATPGTVDNYATCFWSDQRIADSTQGIWYETFGAAPNRSTVINFVLLDTVGPPARPYRYQMILYEAHDFVDDHAAGVARPHVRTDANEILCVVLAERHRATLHSRQFHADMLKADRVTGPDRHILKVSRVAAAWRVLGVREVAGEACLALVSMALVWLLL